MVVTQKNLREIDFGKVDGKAEFSEAANQQSTFFDRFLVPENVDLQDFDISAKYFIQGFRGTGKTSLLRYYCTRTSPKKAIGN